MNRYCSKCNRDLPLQEFCKNQKGISGRNNICRKCDRKQHEEHYLKKFNIAVMKLYGGECVKCGGVENLNILPIETLKLKRRNPRAMVVICNVCKRDGIPSLPRWIRMCSRCKHAWIAKTEITIQCPKCHSSYWHLPRVKK